MRVEEIVYAALSAINRELVHLVSERIYPMTLPQDAIYPAVVYGRTSTDRHMTLCGPSGGATAAFEILSIAQTYAESRRIADAARDAMIAIPGCSVGSDSDEHFPEMDLHQITSEYLIFYTE